jgi:hypothetical protein
LAHWFDINWKIFVNGFHHCRLEDSARVQPNREPARSSPATGTVAFLANSMKFALSTVPEVVI